ncbi:MAG TPA: alpha/beta hydrolase [Chryseolinea sp.]|nr:alpha/beta hydrolase [Chryseolinea sp.]
MKKILFLFIFSNGTLFGQNTPCESIGKKVDIGGWQMHYIYFDRASTDKPTVIFESGIRGFDFDWIPIQVELQKKGINSLSYNRAGYACSQLGPSPHTLRQTVYNLHMLLEKANIRGKLVLVGASLGGLIVRQYAQSYPENVAGLLFVDSGADDGLHYINGKKLHPSKDAPGKEIPEIRQTANEKDNNITKSREAINAIESALKPMGYPFEKVEYPFTNLPDSIQKYRIWGFNQLDYYIANENEFLLDEKAELVRQRKNKDFLLGDTPIVVLTQSGGVSPNDEDIERLQMQKEMLRLSKKSSQILVENSGHHIHMEKPELVIESISNMLGLNK